MKNYEFFLSTPRKLEEVALQEIKKIPGIAPSIEIEAGKAGVHFSCSLQDALRIGLFSRIGSRIYLKAFEFNFDHEKDIPRKSIAQEWSNYLSPNAKIFINTLVDFEVLKDFKNTMFLNLVLKDGISDYFKAKDKPIPQIDKEDPKHQVFQYITPSKTGGKYTSTVYFDLFGRSLSHRGYRQPGFRAPCRENVAAASLLLSEYNPEEGFVDLMSGSGTFVFEAFLIGQGLSPQILNLKNKVPILLFNLNFLKKDRPLFNDLKKIVDEIELHPKYKDQQIYAYDLDRKSRDAILAFKSELGIPANIIEFQNADSTTITCPLTEKGLVFANPPYAKRLGDEKEVEDLYYRLGEHLKNAFKGHKAVILTGNLELRKKIQLRTEERIEIFNGNIESRLLVYNLF